MAHCLSLLVLLADEQESGNPPGGRRRPARLEIPRGPPVEGDRADRPQTTELGCCSQQSVSKSEVRSAGWPACQEAVSGVVLATGCRVLTVSAGPSQRLPDLLPEWLNAMGVMRGNERRVRSSSAVGGVVQSAYPKIGLRPMPGPMQKFRAWSVSPSDVCILSSRFYKACQILIIKEVFKGNLVGP